MFVDFVASRHCRQLKVSTKSKAITYKSGQCPISAYFKTRSSRWKRKTFEISTIRALSQIPGCSNYFLTYFELSAASGCHKVDEHTTISYLKESLLHRGKKKWHRKFLGKAKTRNLATPRPKNGRHPILALVYAVCVCVIAGVCV